MMQSWPSSRDLAGIGVLVTRPEQQAGPLCDLIAHHGGIPIRLPALEIHGPADPAAVTALLERIDRYQLAIFISPNAVRYGLPMLWERCLPGYLRIAAVGKGTARRLAEQGQPADLFPEERFDSEALLALSALKQVEGQRILIFRGNGGRSLLGDTLRQRGGRVDYAEVYRRERPELDAGPLLARWGSEVQVVTATSNEILTNLTAMLGEQGRAQCRGTPLVVISERMRQRAAELGWRRVTVARRADDEAVLEAVGTRPSFAHI